MRLCILQDVVSCRKKIRIIFLISILLFWNLSIAGSELSAAADSAPAMPSSRRVLLISSYHPGFPTFFQQMSGLTHAFQDRNIHLDVEFMDSKRFPDSVTREAVRTALEANLKRLPAYDLILTGDDNAFSLGLEEQNRLFAGLPVVFFGVNDTASALHQNRNPGMTGVVEAVSLTDTIRLMANLQPGIRSVMAISDNTPSGETDLGRFYASADQFPLLVFTHLSLAELSWDEMEQELSRLSPDTGVLLLSAYRDRAGETLLFEQGLARIRKHLSQPLYHLWYHGIGRGILGGKVISHYEQAAAAGRIAVSVLNGTTPGDIPVSAVSPNRYVFDYGEMVRFGIRSADLPDDSLILHQPETFYTRHKGLMFGASAVFLLLTVALATAMANIRIRRRSQIRLKQQADNLVLIFNSIANPLMLVDSSFSLRRINQQGVRLSDKPEDTLIGRNWGAVFSCAKALENQAAENKAQKGAESGIPNIRCGQESECRNCVIHCLVTDTFADGKTRTETEACLSIRSGERILERDYLISTALLTMDGEPLTLLSLVDITRRRRLEAHLRQTRKMEAIGTLAGGIAHDFNNILYPLMGYAEMLQEDLPEDSPSQLHIGQILAGAERARDLVRQILTYARRDHHQISSIRLQPVIDEALGLLRSTLPAIIELRTRIEPVTGRVMGNPGRIHRILINIVTNAWHAMQDTGGVIDVNLEQTLVNASLARKLDLAPGEYAMLSVSDTGTGIPPHILGHVCDPYFTTKEGDKSAGLGLSVVQGIVKSCQGGMRIDSEPDRGTVVSLYFPLAEEEEVYETPTMESTVPGGTERILLVDDEVPVCRMLTDMLRRLDYTVVAHTVSARALSAFRDDPDKVDLVIMDMAMPGITGMQLLKEMRRERADIPVILCTGYTDDLNGIRRSGLEGMSVQGVLVKPVLRQRMAMTIRAALDARAPAADRDGPAEAASSLQNAASDRPCGS